MVEARYCRRGTMENEWREGRKKARCICGGAEQGSQRIARRLGPMLVREPPRIPFSDELEAPVPHAVEYRRDEARRARGTRGSSRRRARLSFVSGLAHSLCSEALTSKNKDD